MSSHDNGHFSSKHPPGTMVSEDLKQAVTERLTNGAISCHEAHALAQEMRIAPGDIGVAIDLVEGRIFKCQLGLFGYGKGKKLVKEARSILPALRDAIDGALKDDFLSCAAAWEIADRQGIPRIAVANACEMLGIKIKPCQLGAF